jgi:hypothetical protein
MVPLRGVGTCSLWSERVRAHDGLASAAGSALKRYLRLVKPVPRATFVITSTGVLRPLVPGDPPDTLADGMVVSRDSIHLNVLWNSLTGFTAFIREYVQ